MFTLFQQFFGTIILTLLVAVAPGFAEELGKPQGEIVLSVSGNLEKTNGDGVAEFDLEMLRAFEVTSFETSTIWTEGTHKFTGVNLHLLLTYLGATGTQLEATAINDYKITIPIETITEEAPIIAYAQDDQPMSRREKGPLWIVYPYDLSSQYRTEVVYSHSIWQLNRLTVLD